MNIFSLPLPLEFSKNEAQLQVQTNIMRQGLRGYYNEEGYYYQDSIVTVDGFDLTVANILISSKTKKNKKKKKEELKTNLKYGYGPTNIMDMMPLTKTFYSTIGKILFSRLSNEYSVELYGRKSDHQYVIRDRLKDRELLPGAQHPQLLPGAQHPQMLPGAQHPQLLPGAQRPQLLPGAQHSLFDHASHSSNLFAGSSSIECAQPMDMHRAVNFFYSELNPYAILISILFF